jgi:hypothetical protein
MPSASARNASSLLSRFLPKWSFRSFSMLIWFWAVGTITS